MTGSRTNTGKPAEAGSTTAGSMGTGVDARAGDRASRLAGPTRRSFIKGAAAASAALGTGIAMPRLARAQDKVIRIGHIDTLTGIRANFGEASPWVVEQIRAFIGNGLRINGQTYAVEILSRDSQSDPNRTGALASDLIFREGIDLMLLGDGLAAPANELCDINQVPLIQTMIQWEPFYGVRGSGPEQGYPWNFLFFWSAQDLIKNLFGLWKSVPTNDIVGTMFVNNEFGQALSGALSGTLPDGGFAEVSGGLFNTDTDDFSNQVSLFKNRDAQIVSGLAFPPHMSTFWGQAGQAGYQPEICTVAGAFLYPSGVEVLGERGNGMSTEIWWTPRWGTTSDVTGVSATNLAAQWEAAQGRQWTQPLGYNYALWEVGLAALQSSADPKDPEANREAIRNLDLTTVIGKVDFRNSPLKSVAATDLAAGQWRRTPNGTYPYDLMVTYNELAPAVPVDAPFKKLSEL